MATVNKVQVIFTVPLSDYDKVNEIPGVSIIGSITDHKGKAILMLKEGNAVELQAQGWNAYEE